MQFILIDHKTFKSHKTNDTYEKLIIYCPDYEFSTTVYSTIEQFEIIKQKMKEKNTTDITAFINPLFDKKTETFRFLINTSKKGEI